MAGGIETANFPTDENVADAPVIFIDGAQGIIANDHLVRFNLWQDRAVIEGGGPVKRIVCARLVMSHSVFQQLTKWLSEHAAEVAKLNTKGG